MLHQRDVIALPFGLVAKTTYSVLPWIGVIALGYAIGPWFLPDVATGRRERRFAAVGVAMLVTFALLRFGNGYGDKPGRRRRQRRAHRDELLRADEVSALAAVPTPDARDRSTVARRAGAHGRAPGRRGAGGVRRCAALLLLASPDGSAAALHGAFALWGATQGPVFAVSDYVWVLVWYAALIVPFTSDRLVFAPQGIPGATSRGSSTSSGAPSSSTIGVRLRPNPAAQIIVGVSPKQPFPQRVSRSALISHAHSKLRF